MSAHFFLTTKVSHGTLGLALCLVAMPFAASSKWALIKFSYLSFRVGVSDEVHQICFFFLISLLKPEHLDTSPNKPLSSKNFNYWF